MAEKNNHSLRYDAVLVLSFGGPEGPEDVLPFLQNVTRGRNIPERRLLEVAEHYQTFRGISPIIAKTGSWLVTCRKNLKLEA
jgi:ferrochelatase